MRWYDVQRQHIWNLILLTSYWIATFFLLLLCYLNKQLRAFSHQKTAVVFCSLFLFIAFSPKVGKFAFLVPQRYEYPYCFPCVWNSLYIVGAEGRSRSLNPASLSDAFIYHILFLGPRTLGGDWTSIPQSTLLGPMMLGCICNRSSFIPAFAIPTCQAKKGKETRVTGQTTVWSILLYYLS
jgi:hypothetical protein